MENHFWQMELSALNFTAALATLHDLPASRPMLEYTYELFLARFPNLATQEGGWAEGLGYFGVNKSAVVDMALLLKTGRRSGRVQDAVVSKASPATSSISCADPGRTDRWLRGHA